MEVLIAISVLAIAMLGIYSLLSSSIRMTSYGKDKMLLIDKGYERLLRHIHYPRVSLPSSEEVGDDAITYTYEREASGMPAVRTVRMKAESARSVVIYEYFETMQ